MTENWLGNMGHLEFWGKTYHNEDMVSAYPASAHMLDVAMSCKEWLLSNNPNIPGVGRMTENMVGTISLLIAIHDIGKFSKQFQSKRPEFFPQGIGSMTGPVPNHSDAGFCLFNESYKGKLPILDELETYLIRQDGRGMSLIYYGIFGHHGRPINPISASMISSMFSAQCMDVVQEFIVECIAILKPEPITIFDTNAFSWWLSGLTVLCDWLGSNTDFYEYGRVTDLRSHHKKSSLSAKNAIQIAGLTGNSAVNNFSWSDMLGQNEPTPLQKAICEIELSDKPLLLIVEEQMGAGKTEAALMMAYRLLENKNTHGIYFALPTTTTSDAQYERLSGYYQKMFKNKASLALLHGKRGVNSKFRDSVVKTKAINDESEIKNQKNAECSKWLYDNKRASLLSEVSVGTIDQALLSVLPNKFSQLRFFGLMGKVLIIDEAHAYDSYVSVELAKLIEFHTKQGGSTIILSATLPSARKRDLVKAYNRSLKNFQPSQDYPLLTTVSGESIKEIKIKSRAELNKTVNIKRLDSVSDGECVAAENYRRGDAVCWIRNTVDEAIETYKALLHVKGVTLFHARFAVGDRQRIEREIEQKFGKNSNEKDRNHILIATQVAEQSLDLDFDSMISDLAPIDLLLQRMGRSWRHKRGNRPAKSIEFSVVSPFPSIDCSQDWLQECLPKTEFVYGHIGILWKSAVELFKKEYIDLPEDIRELVETVYRNEKDVDFFPKSFAQKIIKFLGKDMAMAGNASYNVLNWNDGFALGTNKWESEYRTSTRSENASKPFRLALYSADSETLEPLIKSQDAIGKWQLSEINLNADKVQHINYTSAIAKKIEGEYKNMQDWEREIEIIPLVKEDGNLKASATDKYGRKICLTYSSKIGLQYTLLD